MIAGNNFSVGMIEWIEVGIHRSSFAA